MHFSVIPRIPVFGVWYYPTSADDTVNRVIFLNSFFLNFLFSSPFFFFFFFLLFSPPFHFFLLFLFLLLYLPFLRLPRFSVSFFSSIPFSFFSFFSSYFLLSYLPILNSTIHYSVAKHKHPDTHEDGFFSTAY